MGDEKWVLKVKYNPGQPRVPAGSSEGGQWTSEGGGGATGPSAEETPKVRSMRRAAESVLIAKLDTPDDLARLKRVRYKPYKKYVKIWDVGGEFGHMQGRIDETDTRRGKFTFSEFTDWLESHGASRGK